MREFHEVIIDKEKCTKCGLCVKDCHVNVIEMREDGACVANANCMMCAHCLAICPSKAIDITGFEDEPVEIKEGTMLDPDQFLNHMKARRSVRYFTDEDVTSEDIKKIIKAGQYSPTARNRQTVSYVVLKHNRKEYERVALAMFLKVKRVVGVFTSKLDFLDLHEDFLFKKAPVVIVIKATNDVDGTIAASSMEIMAQSLGLGVFYSGMFATAAKMSPKLKKMLRVGKKEKVVTALVIGHPAVKYKRTAPKERPIVIED